MHLRLATFLLTTLTFVCVPHLALAADPLPSEDESKGISADDLARSLSNQDVTNAIVELRTQNEADWGTPGDVVYCPAGSAVSGFRMKFEPHQGRNGDDTAANGVELVCRDTSTWTRTALIRSSEGPWGNWSGYFNCGHGSFVFGFQTRVEPYQGSGENDDTALNGAIMHCRPYGSDNPQPTSQPRFDGIWGTWSGFAEARCPARSQVIGVQTLVEPPQGRGVDDTALNAIRLYCLRR